MTRDPLPAPGWLRLPAAAAVVLLGLPLVALLVRAPWRTMPRLLAGSEAREAMLLSLGTATAATAIAIVLGVPLAWLLAHGHGRALGSLRVLVTLPVVFPPVVGGVALLMAFGRRGLVGRWLELGLGLRLPFTTGAVVVAQTFVALPFLVLAVEGALRQLDPRHDEAAATLGGNPTQRLFTVTLPQAAPGLAAGAALCWARALGEFGATITFAGNVPGVTQTLPLAVYRALETEPDAAVAMSVLLVAVCVAVLVLLRRRWTSGLWR